MPRKRRVPLWLLTVVAAVNISKYSSGFVEFYLGHVCCSLCEFSCKTKINPLLFFPFITFTLFARARRPGIFLNLIPIDQDTLALIVLIDELLLLLLSCHSPQENHWIPV